MGPAANLIQTVDLYPLKKDTLPGLLELRKPPLVAERDAFWQLNYIGSYVLGSGGTTVAIERLYIDRDYMEDHSVFYSRSLYQYRNYCQRVHFFSLEADVLRDRIHAILEVAQSGGEDAYRNECRIFSREAYLGFMVVKPLSASPVGRTVIRCFETTRPEANLENSFPCLREYSTHFAGLDLTVEGLAFQQQDRGVSACATTALWSVLQKIRDFEDIRTPPPAKITILAAQHSLPFGRAMPSEGLNIGQMCQAIEAVGLSPNVLRASRTENTLSYLYSAVASGFAPVLVLQEAPAGATTSGDYHAVAVAGMQLGGTHTPYPSTTRTKLDDQSSDLAGLFILDDRIGPYIPAKVETAGGKITLQIPGRGGSEEWVLTHILIPTHPKIRISFAGLRQIAAGINKIIQALCDESIESGEEAPTEDARITMINCRIMRAHKYGEMLLFRPESCDVPKFEKFVKTVPMARYLGVISFEVPFLGSFDVLIDTTSTDRDIHCLGVVSRGSLTEIGRSIVSHIANILYSPIIL